MKLVALATVLIVAVAVAFLRPGSHRSQSVNAKTETVTPTAEAVTPAAPPAQAVAQASSSDRMTPEDFEAIKANVPLAQEFKQIVERFPNLNLTAEQKGKMMAAYVSVVSARAKYETSIARATKVSDNETLVEIPKYDGSKLEGELYAAFEDAVGKEKIGAVRDAVETPLALANYGWGKTNQTIDIVLTDAQVGIYKFTRKTEGIGLTLGGFKATAGAGVVVNTHLARDLGTDAPLAAFLPKGGA